METKGMLRWTVIVLSLYAGIWPHTASGQDTLTWKILKWTDADQVS